MVDAHRFSLGQLNLPKLPETIAAASINAKLTSGDTADATRQASFSIGEELGTVNKQGRFTGKNNGAGTLTVRLGEHVVSVPVELVGFKPVLDADFIRDVNPVLAKLGCNAGTCHGAKDGKNGFKLFHSYGINKTNSNQKIFLDGQKHRPKTGIVKNCCIHIVAQIDFFGEVCCHFLYNIIDEFK